MFFWLFRLPMVTARMAKKRTARRLARTRAAWAEPIKRNRACQMSPMIYPRNSMLRWRNTKRYVAPKNIWSICHLHVWTELTNVNALLNFKVFFVIRLIAGPSANSLPPILDPDPLMACDLMDGRDAFLTIARDKHLEFSSLRRAKWSSMCMLVELHNQSQDRFVYTCNECKHHVETRFHCTVCEVRNAMWDVWYLVCLWRGFLKMLYCGACFLDKNIEQHLKCPLLSSFVGLWSLHLLL